VKPHAGARLEAEFMPIPLITEAQFESEVLRAELPVLVDLYADWCQPCKQLHPILDQIASELSDKLKIVRVDIERSPILRRTFRVQSIPMMVLFLQGQPVDQLVGLADKQTILAMVKRVLPSAAYEIEPRELAQLVAQRRVLPVDLRDESSFKRYRIPGAINLPKDQVPARVRELQPIDGRLRVLYGRSADDARDTVEQLRAQGVEVALLSGGFLHWEADGLEVERGV
jgi:thioredoxin 1